MTLVLTLIDTLPFFGYIKKVAAPHLSKHKIFHLALLILFLCSAPARTMAQTGQTNAPGSEPAEPDTLESVLSDIAGLLSEFKYSEAISLFDTIPSPLGESTSLLLLKASALSSAGRYNEARTIAESLLSAEPENIEVLFLLAAVEDASGRQMQQQAALEKIINIESDNLRALIALGNVSLARRSLNAAASYFSRALAKEDANAEALIGLSRAFRMNREWAEAEILLNRAVELYPDMAEARTERARFYWGRENHEQALADLEEAKKLNPGDYWIAIDMGTLLLEMNRKPAALGEFERAIKINPEEYRAYAYSSGLKDDLGDLDGAERDYAALTKLNPDYYFGFEGLGLHKMKNGNWAEAATAFLEAYRRAPDEYFYALLGAINWMHMEDISSPRAFLSQVQAKVKRDTIEWYMFRLFYDLTSRNYLGELDMISRLDRENDSNLKARMLFYMALYYDVRGNTALANKYYLLVSEMDRRAIPEWRLNEWILIDRELKN